MNMLGQEVRTPLVIESQVHNIAIAGAGTTTTILRSVPSIHARVIDVMIQPSVDLDSVSLVIYSASGTLSVTVQVHAGVIAGATHLIRYGDNAGNDQGIGDYYDVIVKTKVAAAAGTATAWTAARS